MTLYRAGLNGAALLGAGLSTPFLLPKSPVAEALSSPAAQDMTALAASISMGVALQLIHVYVTPLKRFVQALWAAGTVGGVYLMCTHRDTGIVDFVGSNPYAVWLVGPLFAAVTGVAVKEGLCYGKGECAALALLTPVLLLSHLSSLAPEAVERVLVAGWAGLVVVFALRKWTQPIQDDIGDKSVFEFYKLPEEEQRRVLAVIEGGMDLGATALDDATGVSDTAGKE